MSNRYSRYSNIKGQREEFAREIILPYERYFHKEAKSQKAQLTSVHKHGTSKDIKIPIKRKMA